VQTVHVRINDTASGQLTPCRVRFTGPGGEYHAPFGRLRTFATGRGEDVGGNLLLGDRRYAYIDGTCEILLPSGPVTVEVSKGPEYRPVRQEVMLRPGQLSLRLALARWFDAASEGWYTGDCDVQLMTPHAALLEAAAEDLAVVNLLAAFVELGSQGPPAISNILAFSGQRPALESAGHVVVVNTLNYHMDLGRVILLNCHRAVYPLTFGRPYGPDDWAVADWCDQCHRKTGLVVGVDATALHHTELLADCILRKVDALLLYRLPSADGPGLEQGLWGRLLDCGFRVPLVGGSGKVSNQDEIGCPRTYARLGPGEPFSYRGWIEAVRAGRTFVTNGPLLFLTVDGQDPGATVQLSGGQRAVHVRAEARSIVPLVRLEVVANGQVVAGTAVAGSPLTASVEADVPMAAGGWLVARCSGPFDHMRREAIGAQTSPVYVRLEGEPLRADPAAMAELAGELDGMLEWVATRGRFENDRQREHLAGVFRDARQELLRRPDDAADSTDAR
jgi:hypothetical protein